jgi:catechol 2,3-dioxygenase-like lactoylglutathione lyase family enzyme
MRPFAIDELDHVVLRCTEPAKMLTFYTEVLGLAGAASCGP